MGEAAGAAPPLYTQLYRRLRESILTGALKPGARLPSARTLAADLRISRNTVEAAVRQLTAEGFVTRRIGSGTVVAVTIARTPVAPPRRAAPPRPPADPLAALSARGRAIAQLGAVEIAADDPRGLCTVDAVGFPIQIWNRLLARRSRAAGRAGFEPAPSTGLLALRQALLDHVRLTRGVRAEVEQVVVVSSTQQAIDLAARVLLDPGAVAAVEEPGYPAARGALTAAGAQVEGIDVDDDGILVDRLAASRARLVYLTPSHQFPLGVTLTLPRRLALLAWAERTGGWILEDDYDSEFRYVGRPIASLQGLDRSGRVLYLGSCNKVLFPGLRLGYLIVPPGLADAFAAARRLTDGYSPPLTQAVLADFLSGGHFAASLRQAREHYARCRDLLVARIGRRWGPRVRLGPSDTGLHLVAHLAGKQDDRALAAAAVTPGLGVAPLSRYYAGKSKRRGLLLSYGACSLEQLSAGVDALAASVVRA